MSNPDHPDSIKLAARGNMAINRLIREIREAEGEEAAEHFVSGIMLGAYNYLVYDLGSLEIAEFRLDFWQRRLRPSEALRNVEPEGRA